MEENSNETGKQPIPSEPTRSGGIDVSGNANIQAQGDVVGRDKIIQNIEAVRPFADSRFSLKTPPSDFMGREHEVDALVNRLVGIESQEGPRIAGVIGMGGVGKSALASKVAEQVKGEFPDAQIWVDMQGTSAQPLKPVDAMKQVISAFEPGVQLKDTTDAQVGQMYRDALNGKRVLVVLDNAKDGPQIRPLLEAKVAVLVTTRTYLIVPGLKLLRLDVLHEDEARTLLLGLCERIGENALEIVELCGRLPLALRIAGSHLAARPNVSVEAYTERLREKRLELLRVRGDGELNVEAAFALTYERMENELQTLWRPLGVFLTSFNAEAAGYIWGFAETTEGNQEKVAPDAVESQNDLTRSPIDFGKALSKASILAMVKGSLGAVNIAMTEIASVEARLHAEEVLGDLVSDSLVEFEAEGSKYRLHDLLRVYAMKKWSAEERERVLGRYSTYLAVVAMQNVPRIVSALNRFIL